MPDPTIACMATIPEREELMLRAVKSLRGQVDAVAVYLNSYADEPKVLPTNIPIVEYLSSEHGGDRGACGKFYPVLDVECSAYVLIVDDDLIYQPGYADFMRRAVDRYGRRAAVSLHGKRFRLPVVSYYADRAAKTKFRFHAPQTQDEPVMVVGTGVMAYHTDALRLEASDFPDRAPAPMANAADLRFSDACHRRGVPLVCVGHTGAEVRQQAWDLTKSIHSRYYLDCPDQTRFLNEAPHGWPLYDLAELRTKPETTQ